MAFTLTSTALAPDQPVPVRHTCDGDDLSPPLAWTDPPAGTVSLALLVDDPDAPSGTFTHWLLCGIGPARGSLEEGHRVGGGEVSGRNDFSRQGYGGPCPPRGHGPHRYRFQLYALSDKPTLTSGFSVSEFAAAIKGRVLGEATLVATYERKS
jgi:hypothetical protein